MRVAGLGTVWHDMACQALGQCGSNAAAPKLPCALSPLHPFCLPISRDKVTSVLPQHWRAPTVAASAAALAAAPPASMAADTVWEAAGGSTHMAGHRPCAMVGKCTA